MCIRDSRYTVGYLWGTVGLMYRTDIFKTPHASWNVLFDPGQQKGPFTLMDSPREMLGIGLRYLGLSVNTTDPAQVKRVIEVMLRAKQSRNFKGFQGGVSATKMLLSNQIVAAVVYNQDVLFIDNTAIPAKAPNPEAAHQFINFILDAQIGARLAEYQQSATPNAAAKKLLKPQLLQNPAIWPTEAQMQGLEFILDQGNNNPILDEAWTRVKSR
jgi:spermidine/putrescine transport system substrate-binding protein